MTRVRVCYRFISLTLLIYVITLSTSVAEPVPNISVDPLFIGSVQPPDSLTLHTLNIYNGGVGDLEWFIDADVPAPGRSVITSRAPVSSEAQAVLSGGRKVLPAQPAPNGLTTITHSASQAIVSSAPLTCSQGDNSFWRVFDLESFGIFNPFEVSEVDIGIYWILTSDLLTISLYLWDETDPFIYANLTPIGVGSVSGPDTFDGLVVPVAVSGLVPAGGNLVVRFSYSQDLPKNIRPGGNSEGQTGPAFFSSFACGPIEPTPINVSRGADFHLVMNVTGQEILPPAVCESPDDLPWLIVSPSDAGITGSGELTELAVIPDSTGLSPGIYSAVLCINSNDPDPGPGNSTDLVIVDVELEVTPPPPEPDPLWCNEGSVAFENGIPTDWELVVSTGDVYWSTSSDLTACDNGGNLTPGSGEAACADSDQTNLKGLPYDTELRSNSFDLTGFNNAVLEFAGHYVDIGTEDMFEVRVWDGSGWNVEAQWDATFTDSVMLNLSHYAGLPDVRVSFRYHGNAWDWYAQVDDVSVTCSNTGPAIDIAPLMLDSLQVPNTQRAKSFYINNIGTQSLNWSIVENAPGRGAPVWVENFESYGVGTDLHGMGGWKGWLNAPASTALTSSSQTYGGLASVEITGTSDLTREFAGINSGQWVISAYQFVPNGGSGFPFFILLNSYDDAGITQNWSTQIQIDIDAGLVISDYEGATLPIVFDQWIPLRVAIDLDADSQTIYYNNQVLSTKSWTSGLSGGGALNLGAINLFGNSASPVYYDNLLLREGVVCDPPSDLPWVSLNPTSGSIAGFAADIVDVTFDSTGLGLGTYTGTLCVGSDDPDPGPGNYTERVDIPVTLRVESEELHSDSFETEDEM